MGDEGNVACNKLTFMHVHAYMCMQVRLLITECWSADVGVRPDSSEVLRRLKRLKRLSIFVSPQQQEEDNSQKMVKRASLLVPQEEEDAGMWL